MKGKKSGALAKKISDMVIYTYITTLPTLYILVVY